MHFWKERKNKMEKIQEIWNKGWKIYSQNHKVIGYKKKALTAIVECKTGAIGAHKYVCDECGYEEIAYNSCRNKHCPNCQAGKKLQWIEARKEEVLNIKYYHVVFTMSDELNLITLQNQSKVYKVLFKASAENFYRAFVLGMLVSLKDTYEVKIEEY